jgi:hypothetical protein
MPIKHLLNDLRALIEHLLAQLLHLLLLLSP